MLLGIKAGSQHFVQRIPLRKDAYQPFAIHDYQSADFSAVIARTHSMTVVSGPTECIASLPSNILFKGVLRLSPNLIKYTSDGDDDHEQNEPVDQHSREER